MKKTENHKIKLIFFFTLIIFFIVFTAYLIFNERGFINSAHLSEQKNKLLISIKNIKNLNKNLELNISRLKNDHYHIEKYARDNFKLIKPDEVIIKIQKREN